MPPSLEWKAVGSSLNDLATTMRTAARGSRAVFAFANSGVLQQAGVVMLQRYITPQNYAETKQGARLKYTSPPEATHGSLVHTDTREDGSKIRNAKGQFVRQSVERKKFVKGKFVARTGNMRAVAAELAGTSPTFDLPSILAHGINTRAGGSGEITAGVTDRGFGYIEITGGYRAAEAGGRGRSNGVKGWWRALRSVQGRWATLVRKKYPDLLRMRGK